MKSSWFANTREYTKDNVTFIAAPIQKGNNYLDLNVGTPWHPYSGIPPLLIKLPDGTVVDTASVNVDVLKAKSTYVGDASANVYNKASHKYEKWPLDAQRLQMGPWSFIIQKGRVVSFYVYYRKDNQWMWRDYVPVIGKSSDNKLYDFPLKQEEVQQIFGDPDEIREYYEE